MELPIAFKNRMKALLGAEAEDFFASFSDAPRKAFHLNTARIDTDRFKTLSLSGLRFEQILNTAGFFYSLPENKSIGNHPLHHAGALYCQDPGAMMPLLGASIPPNFRILDLCAAPGGKTSQLAAAVDGGSGFVIANEINPSRNRILIGNMERMGFRNVIVTCLEPDAFPGLYPEYFDLILVDAPCSGEGMFRKYPESVNEWSEDNVRMCAQRQRTILDAALQCLKPGGILVYSTCTYAPEEDEEQVDHILRSADMQLIPPPQPAADHLYATAPGMLRCYPHRYPGEGQFMAWLQKKGSADPSVPGSLPRELRPLSPDRKKAAEDLLGEEAASFPLLAGRNRLILLPSAPERLPEHGITGLGVTVAEWDEKKKRYIPHHQFFKAYGDRLQRKLALSAEDPLVFQYLLGMELSDPCAFSKGCGAILCEGIPLGGFRSAGGRLKNLYPKGLRLTHL